MRLPPEPVRLPRILAISPPRPGPWLADLHRLPALGAEGLLLRLTDASPDALAAALAAPCPPDLLRLVRLTRPQDADLAKAAGAGLHLPAACAADLQSWRTRTAGRLLSIACHDGAALRHAEAAGADLALLSPIRAPGSKPSDTRPPLGFAGLARLTAGGALPVLALGGMTAADLAAAQAHGAFGIAGISVFFDAQGRVR